MQKLKRAIALLITVLILSMSFITSAYASEATQDGLKAEIILEKDNYNKNEEIPVKIIVTNTNDYDIQNVSIEGLIPEGLTLVSDTAIKSIDLLKAGETLELTYQIMLIENSKPSEPITVTPTTEEPITNTPTTEVPTANVPTTETPTTSEPTTEYSDDYQIGDVNNDKKITASDARLVLRISARLEKASDLQIKAADIDNNGKVTAADARKILRVSAKLDTFENNSETDNKLSVLSLNSDNTKTGNVSVMPLAMNSGKTISVQNESTANTKANLDNIIKLIFGVCLTVIAVFTLFYFTRKDKNFTKRTLSIVLSALIVISSCSGFVLFKAVASEEERKSFTISETVTVDGEDISVDSTIWYEENGNQSTDRYEQRAEVNNTIDDFCNSEKYQKLETIEEKKDAIESLLIDLSKKNLIDKNSIEYDEQQGIIWFKDTCGIPSGIMLKPFSNNIGSTENGNTYLSLNTYENNLEEKAEITTSNFQCSKSIMIYGWDNESDTTGNYNKWIKTANKCNDRNMNMSVLTHTSVNAYKTILLKNDFICIAEHGLYYENIYGFAVYGDEISDYKDDFYKNDIDNKRILQVHDASIAGNTRNIYMITPDFFKHYYGNNTLQNSVIFLSSCMGFGSNGYISYEFAKTFVDECGASACIGFHNCVWLNYSNDLLDLFTMYLSQGYLAKTALEKAKEFCGSDDKEYVENYSQVSGYMSDKSDPPAYPILYEGNGLLTGSVKEQDTNNPLSDITVTATNDEKVVTTQTNANGEFNIKLPVGEWEISIEATGTHYCNEKRTVTVEKDKEITLFPPFYMKRGTKVSGTVKDKGTNSPLSNATVEIFDNSKTPITEGIDGTYNYEDFKLGELIATTTTDENGNYALNLPSGKYALAVNHENYQFYGKLFSVEDGYDDIFMEDIFLTPKGEDDNGGGEDNRTIIASGDCGADGDNVTWVLYDNGELVISGTGKIKDYNYVSTWYSKSDIISTITIENGITSIGNYAFSDLTELKKVILADSITTIGKSVFSKCESLENIDLSNKLLEIGDYAFEDCENLTSIYLPDSLEQIDGGAFWGCYKLEDVTIPNSIISIGGYAFFNCKNLRNIKLPNKISHIGVSAFMNSSLTTIEIPESVRELGTYAFSGCPLTEIYFNAVDCVAIADSEIYMPHPFSGCNNLKKLFIGENVTNIQRQMFYTGITSSITDVYYNAIDCNTNLQKEYNCYPGYESGFSNLNKIVFGDKVHTIPSNLLYECRLLEEVIISESVTSIGNSAFNNCQSLTSITLPNSITSIGDRAFFNCISLSCIDIPTSITSIGEYAFDSCINLTSITINNPNCAIYISYDTIFNTATIYGYSGSTAESYAEKFNRTFIALD